MAIPPDLQSQLETLLDAVFEAEANWRADDRLDLALGFPPTPRTGPADGPAWTPKT